MIIPFAAKRKALPSAPYFMTANPLTICPLASQPNGLFTSLDLRDIAHGALVRRGGHQGI